MAALSVAFVHFAHDAVTNRADPAGWLAGVTRFMPWDAGVDVFFVISGFVIIHASARLFGEAHGPTTFLRRRLTRVIPLYWLLTSAFLAVLLLGKSAIHGDIGGPLYLLASYLFIPWPRPDHVMQPAFGLGWTLNYEMFFYLVMTPFLLFRRGRAVPLAVLCLVMLVATGQIFRFSNPQLGYWSSPLILEFCAGMALAQARAADLVLPRVARLACIAAALVALHLFAQAPAELRPVVWGLPATLLVSAAVFSPATDGGRWHHSILLRLGAASYALYLFHPFVMRGFTLLWRHFHATTEVAGLVYVAAGLVLAQAGALALHLAIEKKLLALLRPNQQPSPRNRRFGIAS